MAEHLTPLQQQDGVSADQTFVDEAGAFLASAGIEGKMDSPYLDDKGIPTVGIGINLHAYWGAYLDELEVDRSGHEGQALANVFKGTYQKITGYDENGKPVYVRDDDAFQSALASAMQPYGGVDNLNLSDAKIQHLYDSVVLGDAGGNDPNGDPAKLAKFKQFLDDHGISRELLTSREGVAVFSLYFNNAGKLLPPTGHLVPDLKATPDGGFANRADAWFQIRYNSNSGSLTASDPGKTGQNGVAKRRDAESTIFGLYDAGDLAGDGTVTAPLKEALAIYANLSENTNGTRPHADGTKTKLADQLGVLTNRQYAFKYEYRYDALIDGTDGANARLHNIKALVSTESVDQLTSLDVEHLDKVLKPAAATLFQHYISDPALNPFAYFYANNIVDALDVQVAASAGGSDLVASQRDGYQLGMGGFQNSVLIAQDGADTLDGSGTANDALIGGTGDDTFIVGDGNDYIVAGTGNALIGGPLSAEGIGGIGSGNDTIVLGDPLHARSNGVDTVWGGTGTDVYYLAPGNRDVIHLGLGQTLINVVNADRSVTPLDLYATALAGAAGTFFDPNKHALILQSPNADGSSSVKIYDLAGAPSVPEALPHSLSVHGLSMDAHATPPSGTDGFLELDNFVGVSNAGVTLDPGATTIPGASNLGDFGTPETHGDFAKYFDRSGTGGGDSMIGSNTTGGGYNWLNGEGNAAYIYAGDGNNCVFADDWWNSPAWGEGFGTPRTVVIQGGSGDQLLVGMDVYPGVGEGKETIIGGDTGFDTTAWTTIDGGGLNVDALLVGGTQNSFILGGGGTDTIVAGSAAPASDGPGPMTIALAGLTFWAYYKQVAQGGGTGVVTGEPKVSFPEFTNAADFQVSMALDERTVDEPVVPRDELGTSYGAPFGLLGSEWNSGTDASPWWNADGTRILLPGTLMIGGGSDNAVLIGNSGNDTLVGGTPLHPTAGLIDEVLVGAGGADVIYGGGGNEWIYGDLSPAAAANWADLDPEHADTIYGGSAYEWIYGSGGDDVFYGGTGSYTIYTGNGNAYVEAGSGNTIVNGGSGNDTIIAGSGADLINTGDGNSYVEVGGGQSTITTGAGNDTIDAAGGETFITEGSGTTTILVGPGSETVLVEPGSSSTTVKLQNGLDESTLIARNVDGNLELSDEDSDAQVWFAGYFTGGSGNVALQFEDGANWGAAQILVASMTPRTDGGNDTLIGSDGNDSITAGYGDTLIVGVSGNNTLAGGAGDDTIQGGSGADTIEGGAGTTQIVGGTGSETYVFNLGDGSDTITENATVAGMDVLSFGAGITQSDVIFSRGSENHLTVAFGTASASTIDIPNFFAGAGSQHQVGTFQFADGTSLTRDQVIATLNPLRGTTGADTLWGTAGADYFDGKGGGDEEIGGGGSDTFVFNPGYGALEIVETYADGQTPVLQLGDGITEASLQVTHTPTWTHNQAMGLVLTDGVSGDQISIDNMLTSSNCGIQEVRFADGTTLTASQLIRLETTGTTGKDELYGSTGDDYFDGKGGSDEEQGNGGSDTFVFNAGYGDLFIVEGSSSGQQPVLQLGPGISPSALRATAETDDTSLILTDGVSGDRITLFDMLSSNYAGISCVQFADGTTWTRDQLIRTETTGGTSASDTLRGGPEADYFDGHGGNDIAIGGAGNDTFVFNPGYGALQVMEYYDGSGDQPVLQIGPGVSASSISIAQVGSNLVLTDGIPGDQITLDDVLAQGYGGYQYGVQEIRFADGSTLTRDQLIEQAGIRGTPGSDTLNGSPLADYFDGKGGNDVEYGAGGSDTFVFNVGYGRLEIIESYSYASPPVPQQPIIQLGAGITLSNLRVASDGRNLEVYDGTNGDEIKLDDGLWDTPNTPGLPVVKLADGTTLTTEQLVQMGTSAGTPGDDSLYGTSGDELFDGRGGDDYENGNGGHDTFVFNPGYGQLTIQEPHVSGTDQGVVRLGAGISPGSLEVTENDRGDLTLTDGVLGDRIVLQRAGGIYPTIPYWDVGVQFADGSTLDGAQLVQSVSNLNGTSGSDFIRGTAGADVLDGKGGNDFALGNGGADTFVFNVGYGALEVAEESGYTIQLGPGITSSNLVASEAESGNGWDLILTDGTPGDLIRLDDMYLDGTASGGSKVQFFDGSTVTLSQLFYQAESNPMFSGDDIYRIGVDAVTQWLGYNSRAYIDVFYVDGITSADVAVRGDRGGNLTLTVRSTDSQFRVQNYFNGPQNVLLHFADGATWGGAAILQASMTPDAGDDLLVGSDGNDTITGGPGNDTIVGVKGANVLTGGTGNSTIMGGSGNDTIEGGTGTNAFWGGTGVETYVFNVGDGSDTISENAASAGADRLTLGSGILPSDVTFTYVAGSTDLLVQFGSKTPSSVTISGFFAAGTGGHRVGSVVFADGTPLSAQEISQQLTDGTSITAAQLIRLETTGTPGDDTIYGTLGADFFDGKGGNDFEVGEGGDDTFVFNPGYGHLEIYEHFTSGQQPVLQLGAGLAASALRVATDGTNLTLTDGVAGDQITLDSMWSNSGAGVALVQLADGTTLTPAQLRQVEMTGTTGDDTLYGTSGDDLIDGNGGNDIEIGNGGNDTFIFNPGYGHLEVSETYTSGQQPVLQLGAGIVASSLQVTASGSNLLLTDGVAGDQITLDNETYGSTYGVALVRFDDGTTLTAAQLIQMSRAITGTPGNDTLKGTSGAELIDGKGGTDSVVGNGGSDTFVFNSGYGSLTINEKFSSGQNPVLQLGGGITTAMLRVTASGNDLVLADGVSGDRIDLYNMWSNTSYGITAAQLDDGTTLTRQQLIQMEMTGTPGNDTLYGTSGADLIDGQGGTDSIVGGGGNDSFVFNSGYGNLTVNETYTSGQQPVLQLGPGITKSALVVTKSGNNLVLADGVSGDQITLINMWSSATAGVAKAHLADGTTLTRQQLIQMEMTGTPGNDTLYGTSGDDLIDGKGGNDSVVGGGGNDTFVFNSGYGQLTVNETYTSGQQPVLKFGSGITSAALHVTKSGNNLVLADGVSGDQVTLINMWSSNAAGVALVKLANGTTLTRDQLIQMEMTGTSGNDTLYGTAGDDLIDGKGGTDSVVGGGGNDTFVFNSGYGKLTVNEAYTSGQQPELKLGTGIAASSLGVTTSGSNLVLTDGVTGDKVTLIGMATSSTNGVETVNLADGTIIPRSQLIQMGTHAVALEAGAAETMQPMSAATFAHMAADAVAPVAVATCTGARSIGTTMPRTAPPRVEDGAIASGLTQTASMASGTAAHGALGAGGDWIGPMVLPAVTVTPNNGSHAAVNHGIAAPAASGGLDGVSSMPPAAADTHAALPANAATSQSRAPVDTSREDSALAPPMPLPAVGTASPLAAGQYAQEAIPAAGAPVDLMVNDPDLPHAGFDPLLSPNPRGGESVAGAFAADARMGAVAHGFGRQQAARTAVAADEMVRALLAQGALRSAHAEGALAAASPADEIQLQGGAMWSVTTLDRTLAALVPARGALNQQTDRAHAMLVNAMASYAPMASAESSLLLPPLPADAYAVAAAAAMQ